MKSFLLVASALLLGATTLFARDLARDGNPQDAQATAAPAQTQANAPAAQTAASIASTANQTVTPGAAPLRVMVGKSLLINTTERLKRVSVTDPSVADALVVTPTQVLINGLAPGEVSLLIWDELERSRSFDLRVDVDITAASEEMHRLFPDEQISVTPSRNAIVVSGHVTTEDVAKHAGALASAYSKNVVNVLTFGPVGAEEVLLEVKFAEVDRTALTQLGLNVFSTGAGNYSQWHHHGTVRRNQDRSHQRFDRRRRSAHQFNDVIRLAQLVFFRPSNSPRRSHQGIRGQEPPADPGRTQSGRGQWQGSQLPCGRRISFSRRPARRRRHLNCHGSVSRVWRAAEVHAGDSAEWQHPPATSFLR